MRPKSLARKFFKVAVNGDDDDDDNNNNDNDDNSNKDDDDNNNNSNNKDFSEVQQTRSAVSIDVQVSTLTQLRLKAVRMLAVNFKHGSE